MQSLYCKAPNLNDTCAKDEIICRNVSTARLSRVEVATALLLTHAQTVTTKTSALWLVCMVLLACECQQMVERS